MQQFINTSCIINFYLNLVPYIDNFLKLPSIGLATQREGDGGEVTGEKINPLQVFFFKKSLIKM